MGETYLARTGDGGAARLVALERLPRTKAGDAAIVRTFLESARAGALLSHPNVVQILDAGRLGSSYFVASEFIDGELLRSIIEHAKAQGRLQVPLRAVLTIVAGIATALHFAHERKSGDGEPGIVHGNLTPSNVIISRDGVVKLLDFGVPAGGLLAYRSPEQLRGGAVDSRSDLFSLGVVVWELLTREPLFERGTEAETREAIENDTVPPPSMTRMDVPLELDSIVGKLLAKDPADRYRDADDLLVDIEALSTKLGFPISTSDLARVMRVWFGSKPNLAGLETHGSVESDELSSESAKDEVDRTLEKVPGLSVAMFELETEEERRAANPTPPPVDVGTPVESFQEIRDRILGTRNKPDSKSPNPRSQAYTQGPTLAPPTEGRTTLQGISPTAINDVISRVTQAASAAGAKTREAVSSVLAPSEPAKPVEINAADAPTKVVDETSKPVEAPPMVSAVAAVAEHGSGPQINGVAKKPGMLAAQAMAEAEAAVEKAEGKAESGKVAAPKSESEKSDRPRSESKKLATAKSERSKSDSKGLAAELADGKPEKMRTKEPSTQIAMSRTQSAEWFERGEQEAKEAHAAHARAIARGRRPTDFEVHDPASPAGTGDKAVERKRVHGLLYPVLGVAAAALVVIALIKIATREPASKVPRHDDKAVALAPIDAAVVQPGSATVAIGSDVGAGSGSAIVAGSAMVAGSNVGAGSGSALAAGAFTPGTGSAVAAVVDAAIPMTVDAAVVAIVPDAAVIAPPIDAAVVVAAKPDAAVAKPDAAVQVAVVADAGVKAPDHTTHKKPDDHKTTETKKPDAPAETIEQMVEKGEFPKANTACATNTRFNPTRLEACALAACNVKDTGLANRWVRAIDRAERDGIIAKCKAVGLELTPP